MIPNGFSGIIPCKEFWDQKLDKIKFETDAYIIYSSEVCTMTKLKMGTNKHQSIGCYISLQSYMSPSTQV